MSFGHANRDKIDRGVRLEDLSDTELSHRGISLAFKINALTADHNAVRAEIERRKAITPPTK